MSGPRGEGLARTGQSPGVSPGSPVSSTWQPWPGGVEPRGGARWWCPPCRLLSLTLRHALQHAHHVYHPDQLRVHGPARPSTLDQICRVSIPRASPAGPACSAFPIRDSGPQGHPSRGPGLTRRGTLGPALPSLAASSPAKFVL